MWARHNGIWKPAERVWGRHSGVWKEAQTVWGRHNGVWKEGWTGEGPPVSTGLQGRYDASQEEFIDIVNTDEVEDWHDAEDNLPTLGEGDYRPTYNNADPGVEFSDDEGLYAWSATPDFIPPEGPWTVFLVITGGDVADDVNDVPVQSHGSVPFVWYANTEEGSANNQFRVYYSRSTFGELLIGNDVRNRRVVMTVMRREGGEYGGEFVLREDGVEVDTHPQVDDHLYGGANDDFSLGNGRNPGAFEDSFYGSIHDLLFYHRELSSSELSNMEGFLMDTWGVS